MSNKIHSGMTHTTVANAQVVLSILFLLGFFSMMTLEGLGYFKVNVTNNLREVLMLVMSFWFMRQRVSGDDPKEQPHPVPTMPATPGPAKSS